MWLIQFAPFQNVPLLRVENGRGYLGFSVGCLLSVSYKAGILAKYKQKLVRYVIVIIPIAVGLILFFGGDILGNRNILVACIVGPVTIWLAIESKLGSLLEWPIFQKMGKLSLPLYMWHCPIYVLFNLLNYFCHGRFNMARIEVYVLTVISTVVCTVILEYLRKNLLYVKR